MLKGYLTLFAVLLLVEAVPAAKPQSSGSMVISRSGPTLFLVNRESGVLSAIDTRSDRVIRELEVGKEPVCIALSPDESLIFVTGQQSGTLAILDAARLELIQTVQVGPEPYGVVAGPGGLVYVASSAAAEIEVVRVASIEDKDLFGRLFYRARGFRSGTLSVSIEGRVPVAPKPKGLALSADGTTLYVTHLWTGDVSIIDLRTLRVIGVVSTGSDSNMSQKIAIDPAGERAYLPHVRSNVTNRFLLFDSTVFPVVSAIDTHSNQYRQRERLDLSLGTVSVNLPFDIAFSPDSRRLYAVNLGSEDVAVMDIASQQRIALIDVGNAPRGIAVTPNGDKAYVVNSLSDNVSVLDLQALRETSRIPIRPGTLTPQIRRGKILFFSSHSPELSTDRWMSCATCHFEAELDGRTWIFPSGPRNTTSLRGVGRTLPLHWSADRDEVQDFEFTIRQLQAGAGLIHDAVPFPELGTPNAALSADLDALAAFVNSIEPKRSPFAARSPDLNQAIERGRTIFNRSDLGCAGCHTGANYSDSDIKASPFIVHDVGTGDNPDERAGTAFDTPSLLGVWDTPPYLHDGSAATLYDVLVTRNRNDRHGRTSHLPAAELEDLITFLLSL
jgi:YVTN family beta-propeller protein